MFLLAAMASVVVVPIVLNYLSIRSDLAPALALARWPLMFVIVVSALSVVSRFGPDREEAQWRWITWGSGFAAVGWIVVSIVFSLYTAHFADYNKTYGSLGAIIAFMFWLWLATTVVLIGAEIDAEMEHQTVRDTTSGRPKPLGERGAKMADTVGAAQS